MASKQKLEQAVTEGIEVGVRIYFEREIPKLLSLVAGQLTDRAVAAAVRPLEGTFAILIKDTETDETLINLGWGSDETLPANAFRYDLGRVPPPPTAEA